MRHEVPCEVAQFWAMYLDPSYLHESFVDGLGWSPPRIIELNDTPAGWSRKVACEPKLSLPASVARFFQTKLGFVETARFDRDQQVLHLQHVTNIFGDRLDMIGTIRAEPDGTRGCVRVSEMSVVSHIPVFGRMIEASVESNMHKGFDASQQFMRKWLARKAAG